MKRGNQQQQIVVAAASEVAVVDGAPVKRVKLLPIGEIAMRDSRGPFHIRDRAHAETIVAATKQWLGSADFNFDYGHAIQRDQAAIAAGWAARDGLTAEDDGIYAEVEWTAAAAEKIAAREYRYLSPLFLAAKDGTVLRLKNAALVNIGAIDLPAIAAGLQEEQYDMSFALIAAALGLSATATEQVIVDAVTALKAKADTSKIAIAAGLAADAGANEIEASITTLKSAKPDPAKFVPVDQVAGMQQQLSALNAERGEREVSAAIQAGKLAPALKEWGTALFAKSEAEWRAYVDKAPVIVAAGAVLDERKPGEKFTSLSADEIAACAALGMSEADFLAAKNEEIA